MKGPRAMKNDNFTATLRLMGVDIPEEMTLLHEAAKGETDPDTARNMAVAQEAGQAIGRTMYGICFQLSLVSGHPSIAVNVIAASVAAGIARFAADTLEASDDVVERELTEITKSFAVNLRANYEFTKLENARREAQEQGKVN
jgi:hypothetical protein